jgi:hypothetical protein
LLNFNGTDDLGDSYRGWVTPTQTTQQPTIQNDPSQSTKEHKKQIEVFFLPSNSPELNPDEYLDSDLKAAVHSGVPARAKKQLKKKAVSHLRVLQTS